jgi:Protein of unknown function (DUF2878)
VIKTIYLHGLFFNICWFLCVIQQWALGALFIFLLWLIFLPTSVRETIFFVTIALIGISIDSSFTTINWLSFSPQPVIFTGLPLWLILLWLAFARFCFHWFNAQYISLSPNTILFGFLGPINYLIGQNFHAAVIEWHHLFATALFILWWLLLSPLCVLLDKKLQQYTAPTHALEK